MTSFARENLKIPISHRIFHRIRLIGCKHGEVLLATVLFCAAISGYGVLAMLPWQDSSEGLRPSTTGTIRMDPPTIPASIDAKEVDHAVVARRATGLGQGGAKTPEVKATAGSMPVRPSPAPQPQSASAPMHSALQETLEGAGSSDELELIGAPISALSLNDSDGHATSDGVTDTDESDLSAVPAPMLRQAPISALAE